jgi:uncharacterized protein
MLDLAWAFVTGLVGSLHCVGMCGPLVVAYSLQQHPIRSLGPVSSRTRRLAWMSHHALFHAGRVVTYGLLGAFAAGFVGLAGYSTHLSGLRDVACSLGGIAMILLGLLIMGLIPRHVTANPAAGSRAMMPGRLIQTVLGVEKDLGRWVRGSICGFLPCMLSWAMIVKASMSGSPLYGFLFMVLFGLGTVPALASVGLGASLLTLPVRITGERIAAISVIAMGLILLYKGVIHLV